MDIPRTGSRSRAGLLKAAALASALTSGGFVAAQTWDSGPAASFGQHPDDAAAPGPALYYPVHDAAGGRTRVPAANRTGRDDAPLVAAPFRADADGSTPTMVVSPNPTGPSRPTAYSAPRHFHDHADGHPAEFGADPNSFYGTVADPPSAGVRPVPPRPVLPGKVKGARPRHPHGSPPGHAAGRHLGNSRSKAYASAPPAGRPVGLWISLPLGSFRNKATDQSHDKSERPAEMPAATDRDRRDKQDGGKKDKRGDDHDEDD